MHLAESRRRYRQSVPIRPEQIAAAEVAQHRAGQSPEPQARLVAGPGTGKSSTIEERVRWLLEGGVSADEIAAISFTRASAFDLRGRIHGYCEANGQPTGAEVKVSTLHSLALRTLRRAGALGAYPVDPNVLDDWELKHVFDAEFGQAIGVGSIKRRAEIRRDHEAYWSTGTHHPPDLIPPDPPITDDERQSFNRFHGPRTQLYSCVLPGEMIRACVERIEAGTLDVQELLGIKHLIVDEFQDLNPMDLRFVEALTDAGAAVFVAGDDDQSLYSFRFAAPAGIQKFTQRYPDAGDHQLEACFRCTPAVLNAALTLIEANSPGERIPKALISLYADAEPPLQGALACASYATDDAEAAGVAISCRRLLEAGVDPRQILILLSNQRAQGPTLYGALDDADVPYEPARESSFRDCDDGRLVLTLIRIAVDDQDYVALRTLLGLRSGVGVGTCEKIGAAAITANVNYRDLFYNPLPDGVFNGRQTNALVAAQEICAELVEWAPEDTVEQRVADVGRLLEEVTGDADHSDWEELICELPGGLTLEELRTYLLLEKDEQKADFLRDVYRRLGEEMPEDAFPPRVRVMSMHGAKGLSARFVFVPGLEEEILPGPWRRPYPGLVLEAARMLYVSITRARLMCLLSYSRRRFMNGQTQLHTPSRFTTHLGRPFEPQAGGITEQAAQRLAAAAQRL